MVKYKQIEKQKQAKGRKAGDMKKSERKVNKHITAIKGLIDGEELTLSAAVSVIIAKWMIDHNLSPDIPERLTDGLKRGELMPLGDIMACWDSVSAGDDWGEKKTIAINGRTGVALERFLQENNLFTGKDSAVIGLLYQKLLSTARKKQGGVFYTPPELAALLARMTGPAEGLMKILDPACGGGALLAAMYDKLLTDNPTLSHREILRDRLWGIDTDALAVIVCRAVLALKNKQYVYPGRILRADALFDLQTPQWRDFDRVIANPPYIGHKALKGSYMDALRQKYPRVYGDKGDIAYCFYQNAVNRLKDGGIAAFLVSRYFTEAQNGEGLRRFLSEETRIKQIIDYNGERVIKGVGIDPMIIVFEKRADTVGDIDVRKRVIENNTKRKLFSREPLSHPSGDSSPYQGEPIADASLISDSKVVLTAQNNKLENFQKIVDTEKRKAPQRPSRKPKPKLRKAAFPPQSCVMRHATFTINPGEQQLSDSEILPGEANKSFDCFTIPQSSLGAEPWHLNDPMTRQIVDKIQGACESTLGGEGEFFQGIITGADGVFVIKDAQKEALSALSPYLRPWIKNSRVHPCLIDKNGLYLIYVRGNETDMSPELVDYLAPHKERLSKRRECKTGSIPWYALQWPRKPELFDGEKIIFPYKAEKNRFAVDEGGLYFSADVYGFIPGKTDAKALCVLLNSACYNRYFKSYAKKLGGALYEYYPNTLKRLAIPEADASIYCELAPYYDIIKTSNNADEAMESAEAIIAGYFGLSDAQKRHIGVNYAKKLF